MELISPYDLGKAKEGSLFIKKGNKLVAVSFKELSKELESKCDGIVNTKQQVKVNEEKINNLIQEFNDLKKSHFITVFSLFELKALKGEIEVEDESLLDLDTKVLLEGMNVEEALNSHEFLRNTYDLLFGKVEK